MKKTVVVFGLLLLGILSVSINAGANRPAKLTPDLGYGQTPLYFIANQGQTDRGVFFMPQPPAKRFG